MKLYGLSVYDKLVWVLGSSNSNGERRNRHNRMRRDKRKEH